MLPAPPRLMLLSILAITASTQPVFLLGAGVVDIGTELGFGPFGLGLLTAAFFLTAAAASTPLGHVVERIGWRRALRINMAMTAVVLLAIAGLARSTSSLALLLVCAGGVYGFANPVANRALADRVDPSRRALVFGMKHAGIPASTLIAGLAVPVLITTAGWRWSYVASISLAALVLLLVPAFDEEPTKAHADQRRFVARLTLVQLFGLALAAALAAWAAVGLGTYLVAAAVDEGFSESVAGLLLFAGSAASIAGRLIAGAVTDALHGRGFASMAVLTSTGAAVFFAISFASGAAWAVLIVVAFFTGWAWPGLMTFIVVNANTSSAAASSAVTQAGVFMGAGGGPIVLGWIADRWSFEVVWVAVACALLLATVVVISVARTVSFTAPAQP